LKKGDRSSKRKSDRPFDYKTDDRSLDELWVIAFLDY